MPPTLLSWCHANVAPNYKTCIRFYMTLNCYCCHSKLHFSTHHVIVVLMKMMSIYVTIDILALNYFTECNDDFNAQNALTVLL